MDVTLARALVWSLGTWLGLGAIFAVPFVIRGVDRLDPDAHGSGWGFRLILLPGVAALWPLLAWRLIRRAGPPEEHNAHRDAARSAP